MDASRSYVSSNIWVTWITLLFSKRSGWTRYGARRFTVLQFYTILSRVVCTSKLTRRHIFRAMRYIRLRGSTTKCTLVKEKKAIVENFRECKLHSEYRTDVLTYYEYLLWSHQTTDNRSNEIWLQDGNRSQTLRDVLIKYTPSFPSSIPFSSLSTFVYLSSHTDLFHLTCNIFLAIYTTTNRMYFSNVICQLGWHGTDIVTVFCLEWCIVPLTLHSFYMLLVKTFNADLHNQFPFRFQVANFLLSQRVSRDRKMSLRWLGRDGWICIRMQRSYPFRRGSTLLKLLNPEEEIAGRLSGNHRRSYLCLIVFRRFAQRQS